mmetsp:Transcript_120762/g.376024  ORF Transcript_120762/g.376024 Transcript_120762/m.376024 type:complete len:235 (+) Transcript_120762:286-990(+)
MTWAAPGGCHTMFMASAPWTMMLNETSWNKPTWSSKLTSRPECSIFQEEDRKNLMPQPILGNALLIACSSTAELAMPCGGSRVTSSAWQSGGEASSKFSSWSAFARKASRSSGPRNHRRESWLPRRMPKRITLSAQTPFSTSSLTNTRVSRPRLPSSFMLIAVRSKALATDSCNCQAATALTFARLSKAGPAARSSSSASAVGKTLVMTCCTLPVSQGKPWWIMMTSMVPFTRR